MDLDEHGGHSMSKDHLRARILAVSAALLLLAAVVVPASAAGGATIVQGTQLAYGSCGAGTGYAMTGSLDGCWWIDTFESSTDPSKHNYRATGQEHFQGCLGTVCGSFETTYIFTAKTDGPWGEGATEIHGRCHHPIVPGSGTGGFTGVTGQLSFHDVVDVSPPYYPYHGSLRLVAGAGTGITVVLGASSSADAGGATC
jgi:hypothetical protein